MTTPVDVVVVGGGIAGASLARALAVEGLGVTVLEASVEFPDRVRGESMQLWGLAEARLLGVEDVLMAAGAHITPTWRQYFPDGDDPRDFPMNMLVPDIPGSLNLRHPDACQALLDAAAAAGATVIRGVADVGVSAGPSPSVRYAVDGTSAELRPSLVVGADGRRSVTRRALGIELGAPSGDQLHRRPAARWARWRARRPRRHRRRRRPLLPLVPPGQRAGTRIRLHRPVRPAPLRRPRRHRPLPRGVRGLQLSMERAGLRSDTCRPVRHLPRRRHLVRRAVRGRCRADRRCRRPQRPDRRPRAVDRDARRTDDPRPRARGSQVRRRLQLIRGGTDGPHDPPPSGGRHGGRRPTPRTPTTAPPAAPTSASAWRAWRHRSSR